MLVHCKDTPSINFAGTHSYTWVERGTVRVKCLAQEHNAMSLAKAQTQTTGSRDKHTNHEAIAPHSTDMYFNLSSLCYIAQKDSFITILETFNIVDPNNMQDKCHT